MMPAWCWLSFFTIYLAIQVIPCEGRPAGDSDNLIDSNLQLAVAHVESELSKRTDVPRLTRGEIIELIEDVRRNRSLVVVMPFKANSTEGIEELYTKSPVTEVVGLSDQATSSTTRRPLKRRRKPSPRPVYVRPETNESSSTTSQATTTSASEYTVSTTQTKPTSTTDNIKTWQPLNELHVPEEWSEPLDGITVQSTSPDKYHEEVFITPITSTESSIPPRDVSVAAESLSDDMKELLATFGLLGSEAPTRSPQPAVTSTTIEPYFDLAGVKPQVDPSSYLTFKPLPPTAGDDMSPDMQEFLASFGLINDGYRSGKSFKPRRKVTREDHKGNREIRVMKEVPKIDSEMLSSDMKAILEDLGLMSERNGKKLGGEHVFNPASVQISDTEKLERIKKLMVKLREVSNTRDVHSMTTDEIKEVLGDDADLLELGEDGNLLYAAGLDPSTAPDPLSIGEFIEIYDKNEFKRQENAGTTEQATSRSDSDISQTEFSSSSAEAIDDTISSSTTQKTSLDGIPTKSSENDNIELETKDEGASSISSTEPSGISTSTSTTVASTENSSKSDVDSTSPSPATLDQLIEGDGKSVSDEGNGDSERASASDSSVSESSSGTDSDASSDAASQSSTSVTSSEDVSPSSSTLQLDSGPSVDDLEDSFGGEITTTPRPNGLYFLLDWNSFLQVGQDERRVDLAFSPKIGDPKNFYPIKFP